MKRELFGHEIHTYREGDEPLPAEMRQDMARLMGNWLARHAPGAVLFSARLRSRESPSGGSVFTLAVSCYGTPLLEAMVKPDPLEARKQSRFIIKGMIEEALL